MSRRAPCGARELKHLVLELFLLGFCRAPCGARELKLGTALVAVLTAGVAPHAGRVN